MMIVLKVMLYSTQKKKLLQNVCVYVNLCFATNATFNIVLCEGGAGFIMEVCR